MDDIARVITQAKTTSGLTNAEFDYSLATGDTSLAGALNHITNAVYAIANPDSTGWTAERSERARALHARLWPQIEQRIAAAKAKQYIGWSDASRGPIR